jgi:hypothetical protein
MIFLEDKYYFDTVSKMLHLCSDSIIKMYVISYIELSYVMLVCLILCFIYLSRTLVQRPQDWYDFGGHDTEPVFKLLQFCFDLFHIIAITHFNIKELLPSTRVMFCSKYAGMIFIHERKC